MLVSEQDIERGREAGVDVYLTRPYSTKGLIQLIKTYFNAESFLMKVKIREFRPSEDTQEFIRCHNRAFITAPDPYRSLTLEDVQHFKPESTFVAVLYGRIVGFIFLVIEPLIKQGINLGKQGVIAGLGVDPRYHRKRIAFLLAARAGKFFAENNVSELVCEVFHANKVSYSFICHFGFTRTGIIYL